MTPTTPRLSPAQRRVRRLSVEKQQVLEFLSQHGDGMWVILTSLRTRLMCEQLERSGYIEPFDGSATAGARPVRITEAGRAALAHTEGE